MTAVQKMKKPINNGQLLKATISLLLLGALAYHASLLELLESLKKFPLEIMALSIILIGTSIFMVTFRYWRILNHFGHSLSWRVVYRACAAANLASLVIIPLLGQLIGRQALLRGAGVTSIENALIAIYERLAVGGVSAIFALIGSAYLIESEVQRYIEKIPYVEIFCIIATGILLKLASSTSKLERELISKTLELKNLIKLLEILTITTLTLSLTILSFTLIFYIAAPNTELTSLLSAAAITSFVASLPISFAGWGPRELAAIYTLGLFGVPSKEALSASILCGVLSIISVLLLSLWSLTRERYNHKNNSSPTTAQKATQGISMPNTAAWIFAMAIALLIFFQLHVTLVNTSININLSDLFAVLALTATVLYCISERKLPRWHVQKVNLYLCLITSAMLVSFLIGWSAFGISSWAVTKLAGWFVLLGFMSAGYLCVSNLGIKAFRHIIEHMVAIACAIIVLQLTLRAMHFSGLIQLESFSSELQGYSGNRNALAFQLIALISVFSSQLSIYRKAGINGNGINIPIIALSIMIVGVLFTASRSGILTLATILISACILKSMSWRELFNSTLLALLLCTLLLTASTR